MNKKPADADVTFGALGKNSIEPSKKLPQGTA